VGNEKSAYKIKSIASREQRVVHYYVATIVTMAPIAISVHDHIHEKDTVQPRKDSLGLPEPARKRLEKAGIDLTNGYPYRPAKPLYLDDVYKIRDYDREHIDPGSRADPKKKALFGAAKEIIHLTAHIGTEVVGLQLKDLSDQQKDELGLLIAERSVVFFRDQDLSPQEQKKLGEWYGEIEVHVCCPSRATIDMLTSGEASSPICTRSARGDRSLARSSGDRSTC
jgi:hypothetical protein